MIKKLLLALALCVLVIPMAFATDCYVANNCGIDNTIMAVSDNVDAHAGIVGTSTYTDFLCCRELAESGGPDTILFLSDTDNAHVQTAAGTGGYVQELSATLLAAQSLVLQNTPCDVDECVLTFSDDDNAHVTECGHASAYTRHLCLDGAMVGSGIDMDCGPVSINTIPSSEFASSCVERGIANPFCLAGQCNYEDTVGVATCYNDGAIRQNEDGRDIECHTEVAGFNTWCPVGYNWDGTVCTANTAVCDQGYSPETHTNPPYEVLDCYLEETSASFLNPSVCFPDDPSPPSPYDQACCYDFDWPGATTGDPFSFYSNTLPESPITVY